MKVTKSTISFERTLQISNYEPLKISISEEIEYTEKEGGSESKVSKLRKDKIKELRKELIKEEASIKKHYGD